MAVTVMTKKSGKPLVMGLVGVSMINCRQSDKEKRQRETEISRSVGLCRAGLLKRPFHFPEAHLYKKDDEEVEICNSSKLFKQVLWNKVPEGVLWKEGFRIKHHVRSA